MAKTIKLQEPKTELVNILRWEDDGGTITEPKTSVPDRHFIPPVPVGGKHVTSLQWNERFVIEPFQAGTRIGWRAGKAPIKKRIAQVCDQAHVPRLHLFSLKT